MALIAAFLVYVDLSLSGWPDRRLSEPQFANEIADQNWNDPDSSKLDKALTAALRKRFPVGGSASNLVDALNTEGFLAKPEHDGVCQGKYSGLVRWITGCVNRDADLDKLKRIKFGAMYYDWGGPVCTWTMTVSWSVGGQARVKSLNAESYALCL